MIAGDDRRRATPRPRSPAVDGAPYPHSLSATAATEDADATVAFPLSGHDIPPPEVTPPAVFLAFPSAPST